MAWWQREPGADAPEANARSARTSVAGPRDHRPRELRKLILGPRRRRFMLDSLAALSLLETPRDEGWR
jgi:hypothetical protein